MKDNEKQFIIELEAISRKYGLSIHGCGCCGSPSLMELPPEQMQPESGYKTECGDEIGWASPTEFGWDRDGYMYKDKVVKP